MFCKNGVFLNFAELTGKHLCQSLFFNKVAGFRSATLLKNRLWHRCFPVSFANFLRTPIFIEHLWWLLLIKELVNGNTDIFLLPETKLDETFPNKQFETQGYKTFRRNRNKFRGGIMIYVNLNITSGVSDFDSNVNVTETIFLKLSLRNKKCLCAGLYKPANENKQYFLKRKNDSDPNLII